MITFTKILFIITILVYLISLLLIRTYSTKKIIILSFLLNCFSQVYLLTNGIIAYTVAFLVTEAAEAAFAGLVTEYYQKKEKRVREMIMKKLKEILDKNNKNEIFFNEFWLNESPDGDGEETLISSIGYYESKITLTTQEGKIKKVEDLNIDDLMECVYETNKAANENRSSLR